MPPKRKSDAGDASPDASKKTKTTPEASSSSSSFDNSTRWSSKSRYSAVSNSRNADLDYKKAMEDPEYAFTYVVRCPFGSNDEDEEDEDDFDSEAEEDEDKPSCDGGKTCLCGKLATEHPDAPFVMTRAGFRKLMNQQPNCQVRDPDSMGMYTYNDHAAYGIMEVLENLILDFDEASQNWKEQWVVCEAMAPFIWYLSGAEFGMCDDGDRAKKMAKLVGTMFLSMLARLEREGQLKPDSEARDIGMVMAGMIKTAEPFRDFSLLEDEGKTRKSNARPFPYAPSKYNEYIAAYAKKYNIKLGGVKGVKTLTEGFDENIALPEAGAHGEDPWGFKAALKEYKSSVAGMGGDKLDITSWKPAERKNASFSKKEPLPKDVLDGIKKGMVVGLG
ncbi:hypothetical protein CkaCkLH20_01244 [Colletotrichum karsti]|uniref:Uncharacterized protein n=1 Tax=Colletotrichum karsti TaxID=1095194 RepID=A0A9P6IER4_9PEZI|nr:uncharacterized protein CkaCkLH20_01244 [Colletotrichum karsti]KAF9881094.1 hypothetical protein CkaCkLH20_01244 [Colletotrichum karsti]